MCGEVHNPRIATTGRCMGCWSVGRLALTWPPSCLPPCLQFLGHSAWVAPNGNVDEYGDTSCAMGEWPAWRFRNEP